MPQKPISNCDMRPIACEEKPGFKKDVVGTPGSGRVVDSNAKVNLAGAGLGHIDHLGKKTDDANRKRSAVARFRTAQDPCLFVVVFPIAYRVGGALSSVTGRGIPAREHDFLARQVGEGSEV